MPNEDPEAEHTCDIAHGKAGQEGKEGITEIHGFCDQKEKEYPDLVLEPKEDPWPELSEPLRERDEDQVKAHNENIEALLVLVSIRLRVVFVVHPNHLISFSSLDYSLRLSLRSSSKHINFCSRIPWIPQLKFSSKSPCNCAVSRLIPVLSTPHMCLLRFLLSPPAGSNPSQRPLVRITCSQPCHSVPRRTRQAMATRISL